MISEEFKTVYLTFYNLFMYIGFIYIACVLCIKFAKDGVDFFPKAYDTVGPAMKFFQLLQFLEVMHPLFGYVKGGMLMPFLQIAGRAFILFLMLDNEPRIQKMPVTFYLFLTWSAIEIIRYVIFNFTFKCFLNDTTWNRVFPLQEMTIIDKNSLFICKTVILKFLIIVLHRE